MDRLGADKGKNDPRTRWKRAVFLVSRMQDKNTLYARDESYLADKRCQEDKMLETQHWLELVDAYVEMRKLGEDVRAAERRITATTRQLESMIRLAEAHAKLGQPVEANDALSEAQKSVPQDAKHQ